jgi:hypothetical protein
VVEIRVQVVWELQIDRSKIGDEFEIKPPVGRIETLGLFWPLQF